MKINHHYSILLTSIIYLSSSLLVRSQSSLFRTSFENSEQPSGSFETTASFFNNNNNPNSTTAGLVWQPLRATFRPLNRGQPPARPSPPVPPSPPAPPTVPQPPEPLALVSNLEPEVASSTFNTDFLFSQPITTTTTSATTTTTSSSGISTTTPAPISFDLDEDLPTRVPLSSFRPTKSPSVDAPSSSGSGLNNILANSRSQNQSQTILYRITSECFECICEASTSCNINSRCQTSDVRHTRCGMFLVSYDQWLGTGLSKQLVTREQLARDPAADERAFYECVTDRDCAERLMSIYMQKNLKDCNKDGKIDCYDVASIHQGGTDQCNSESLLDSQYWNDFNACFGFGR